MTATPFENFDGTMWADILFALEKFPPESAEKLRRVLSAPLRDAPIDDLAVAEAIAAAEIVAHCMGRGRGELTGYVEPWVKRNGGLIGIEDAVLAKETVSTLLGWRGRVLTFEMTDDEQRGFTLYLRGLRARLGNAAAHKLR
jgi:hypothetical protein